MTNKKKKVKISVYWPDDWKSIILDEEQWQEILKGKPFSDSGEGYYYEGEKFSDYWEFGGGPDGKVYVTYDGGGVGFDGVLSDCEIEVVSGKLRKGIE